MVRTGNGWYDGPETYGSFHQALGLALGAEHEFAKQEGAKIKSPTRVRNLHGMEVLMFEGSNGQGATSHVLFFRSGSYLLTVVIWVVAEADREQIVHFLNSIRVNGRDTALND